MSMSMIAQLLTAIILNFYCDGVLLRLNLYKSMNIKWPGLWMICTPSELSFEFYCYLLDE